MWWGLGCGAFNRARILLVIAGLSLPIPSTRNHLIFFFPCYLQQGQVYFAYYGFSLSNPSTRNHFFLLHGALNMVNIIFCIVCFNLTIPSSILQSSFQRARILLVITGLPLPIPYTRNHLFLIYGVFNRARVMFGIAGLPVAISSFYGLVIFEDKCQVW